MGSCEPLRFIYAGTSSIHLTLNEEHGIEQAGSASSSTWEFSKGTRERKGVNELMNVIVMDCARLVCDK